MIVNFFVGVGLAIAMFFSGLSAFAVKTDVAGDAWHLKPPPANAAEQLAVLPSPRQIAHAELEYYGFVHFGINTFTGREWGTGAEDPALFNPAALDTDQWAKAMADAGMKGAILTAKHHDGFCLWPSAHTEHSVKNSPYKDGQGVVVAQFAQSCRKYGLQFGFYLSPWDMHEPTYGTGAGYDEFYTQQLRELQPNAVICVAGPDVAWVGNEDGLANGNVSSVRGNPGNLHWKKSECDVSIRPGWFFHGNERPKSLSQLMYIYYNSVGMNCALLLNIPPNADGLFDRRDVERLACFRGEIDKIYASPVVPSEVSVSDVILKDDAQSYMFADDEYCVDFTLDSMKRLRHVVLSEDSNVYSERIRAFSVYAKLGPLYIRVGRAQSAGNKTIVKLSALTPWTDTYRIVIEQSKANPVLRYVGLYT